MKHFRETGETYIGNDDIGKWIVLQGNGSGDYKAGPVIRWTGSC